MLLVVLPPSCHCCRHQHPPHHDLPSLSRRPEFFGYLPKDPLRFQGMRLGMVVGTAGSIASKVISISCLLASQPGVGWLWFVAEFGAFVGLRGLLTGQWRMFAPGLESLVPTFVCNLGYFVTMLFTPAPYFRCPPFVTPAVWCFFSVSARIPSHINF